MYLQTTGVLFAPVLRHIAPSLLGWNRFVAANNELNRFVGETIDDHIKKYTDNNKNRYNYESTTFLIDIFSFT